jgi:tRNA(Ile)-lysidine synthase
MNIDVEPGKYVVAVSGGVDSVVLLDLLSKQKNLDLVVAHYDHGIRDDSQDDREFVEKLAEKYDVEFEYDEGNLGEGASEAIARKARYTFLQHVESKYNARAIITAHHQDDILETLCINILRGTNRKGLSSLQDTDGIKRPLLAYSKNEIIAYVKQHNLTWREDSTNTDQKYLRNWIRHNVISKLSKKQRQQLIDVYNHTAELNQSIETILDTVTDHTQLDKKLVIASEHKVSMELIAHWLRQNGLTDFDSKTLDRIVIGIKTLANGKEIPIYGRNLAVIGQEHINIVKKN